MMDTPREEKETKLKEGDKAPSWNLRISEDRNISLAEFKGRFVVLYFYPKDNTPGCTTEAIEFSKLLPEFRKEGVEIVGVSPDSCESHRNFINKHKLGITLASDETKEVMKKYGVWQKKKNYGREYFGVVRSTFLIGPDGRIVKAWYNVKANGHAGKVLEEVRNIKSSG
ncbi:peroxiredoxin [Candidatus Woesearchaeota archaeon]|nr:MAG: peroxiredoxin [Candidatus Woesearchaeota archaeon]